MGRAHDPCVAGTTAAGTSVIRKQASALAGSAVAASAGALFP